MGDLGGGAVDIPRTHWDRPLGKLVLLNKCFLNVRISMAFSFEELIE